MSESRILLEDWSPCCNIQAFVEESDTCCYFYLYFHPGRDNTLIKSCWICNTAPSPKELDVDAMHAGNAPALPEKFVNHDPGGIKLNPQTLSVVWFEEGDAAALLEGEQIICVIPGWSGYKGFSGYSRYVKGTAPYAWELPTTAEEVMSARVKESRKFWTYLEGEFWEEVQKLHLQVLEAFFGTYEKYFAIDGGEFPPKALVSGKKDGICYGITAGVSLLPMPAVEQYYEEKPGDFRRIELGFAVTEEKQEVCTKMYSFLSAISNMPWEEVTFLGHGHTIPCDVIEGFVAVWLLDARVMPEIVSPTYPTFRGDCINLLWAVPLKQEEYDWLCDLKDGTAAALEQVKRPVERLIIFDGEGKLRPAKGVESWLKTVFKKQKF